MGLHTFLAILFLIEIAVPQSATHGRAKYNIDYSRTARIVFFDPNAWFIQRFDSADTSSRPPVDTRLTATNISKHPPVYSHLTAADRSTIHDGKPSAKVTQLTKLFDERQGTKHAARFVPRARTTLVAEHKSNFLSKSVPPLQDIRHKLVPSLITADDRVPRRRSREPVTKKRKSQPNQNHLVPRLSHKAHREPLENQKHLVSRLNHNARLEPPLELAVRREPRLNNILSNRRPIQHSETGISSIPVDPVDTTYKGGSGVNILIKGQRKTARLFLPRSKKLPSRIPSLRVTTRKNKEAASVQKREPVIGTSVNGDDTTRGRSNIVTNKQIHVGGMPVYQTNRLTTAQEIYDEPKLDKISRGTRMEDAGMVARVSPAVNDDGMHGVIIPKLEQVKVTGSGQNMVPVTRALFEIPGDLRMVNKEKNEYIKGTKAPRGQRNFRRGPARRTKMADFSLTNLFNGASVSGQHITRLFNLPGMENLVKQGVDSPYPPADSRPGLTRNSSSSMSNNSKSSSSSINSIRNRSDSNITNNNSNNNINNIKNSINSLNNKININSNSNNVKDDRNSRDKEKSTNKIKNNITDNSSNKVSINNNSNIVRTMVNKNIIIVNNNNNNIVRKNNSTVNTTTNNNNIDRNIVFKNNRIVNKSSNSNNTVRTENTNNKESPITIIATFANPRQGPASSKILNDNIEAKHTDSMPSEGGRKLVSMMVSLSRDNRKGDANTIPDHATFRQMSPDDLKNGLHRKPDHVIYRSLVTQSPAKESSTAPTKPEMTSSSTPLAEIHETSGQEHVTLEDILALLLKRFPPNNRTSGSINISKNGGNVTIFSNDASNNITVSSPGLDVKRLLTTWTNQMSRSGARRNDDRHISGPINGRRQLTADGPLEGDVRMDRTQPHPLQDGQGLGTSNVGLAAIERKKTATGDVLRSLDSVEIAQFSRDHLLKASSDIQRDLRHMISAWADSGKANTITGVKHAVNANADVKQVASTSNDVNNAANIKTSLNHADNTDIGVKHAANTSTDVNHAANTNGDVNHAESQTDIIRDRGSGTPEKEKRQRDERLWNSIQNQRRLQVPAGSIDTAAKNQPMFVRAHPIQRVNVGTGRQPVSRSGDILVADLTEQFISGSLGNVEIPSFIKPHLTKSSVLLQQDLKEELARWARTYYS